MVEHVFKSSISMDESLIRAFHAALTCLYNNVEGFKEKADKMCESRMIGPPACMQCREIIAYQMGYKVINVELAKESQ